MAAARPALLLVAGEASGDAHAARVLERLHQRLPGLDCFGLGGAQLRAAGQDVVADGTALNVVGLSEVVRGLSGVLRLRDRLLAEVERRRPAAALLVDLPGFNLHLAGRLKRMGVPVIYYIAPQAWAWRRGRVRKIRRRVDQLCVIFPFEREFFGRRGVAVEYVGHPLLEQRVPAAPPIGNRVALLPGSRPREVERLLPAIAGAAQRLRERWPELRFRLPLAPGIAAGPVQQTLAAAGVEAELVGGGAATALRGARLGLVASGTATLEAALAGVPMVVVYRVSRTSYALVRPLFQLDHVCIVNILAGRRLVPELLQSAARPEPIAAAAAPLLADSAERRRVLAGLAEVAAGLSGPRPSERVAGILAARLQPEAA